MSSNSAPLIDGPKTGWPAGLAFVSYQEQLNTVWFVRVFFFHMKSRLVLPKDDCNHLSDSVYF